MVVGRHWIAEGGFGETRYQKVVMVGLDIRRWLWWRQHVAPKKW
jgi:hypothetical protein